MELSKARQIVDEHGLDAALPGDGEDALGSAARRVHRGGVAWQGARGELAHEPSSREAKRESAIRRASSPRTRRDAGREVQRARREHAARADRPAKRLEPRAPLRRDDEDHFAPTTTRA